MSLYPPTYRHKYEAEVLQTTADMLDDAPDWSAKAAIWTKVVIDLPFSLSKQQLQYVGGVLHHETPHYIKRNSLIAGALLAPFFSALIANSLDKLIYNQTLMNSWLWKSPALSLWVLYLPETALFIALASYLAYIYQDSTNNNHSAFRRALDIKHSWPIIIPTIIALGILFIVAFHDSVQCWVEPPSYLVSHVSQAWQCTIRNQSLKAFRHSL